MIDENPGDSSKNFTFGWRIVQALGFIFLSISSCHVLSPGLEIPVRGEMQKETRPFPAQIHLGSHKIKSATEGFLPFRAPQDKGWKVEQIEIDSPT